MSEEKLAWINPIEPKLIKHHGKEYFAFDHKAWINLLEVLMEFHQLAQRIESDASYAKISVMRDQGFGNDKDAFEKMTDRHRQRIGLSSIGDAILTSMCNADAVVSQETKDETYESLGLQQPPDRKIDHETEQGSDRPEYLGWHKA